MKKCFLLLALVLGFTCSAMAQNPGKELFKAVMKNDAAAVETLLQGGADPNAPVEVMPGFRTSYLITAATNGNLAVVKALIQHKAQVNAKDAGQETALMVAAGKGNREMVEFLLANGADAKAQDSQGNSVLTAAKASGNASVVTLIESKAK